MNTVLKIANSAGCGLNGNCKYNVYFAEVKWRIQILSYYEKIFLMYLIILNLQFIQMNLNSISGQRFFTQQDLLELLSDTLDPIQNNLIKCDHYFDLLCMVFWDINSMPVFKDVGNLPIVNHNPKKTYKRIVNLCLNIIDRAFLKDKEKTAIALIEAIELINPHVKVSFHDEENFLKHDKDKKIFNKLNQYLLAYHNLYDGRYKISLSYFHYINDVIYEMDRKSFNNYTFDDVSYKIKQIKISNSTRLFIEDIEWLNIGADEHVRNAIAHKRWKFIDCYVELNDRGGWSKKLTFIEIEDLYRSLKISSRAMESAIIIGLIKYYEQFLDYIPYEKKDKETVEGIIGNYSLKSEFALDSFTIRNEFIFVKLKSDVQSIGPRGMIVGYNKGQSKKFELPPMAEPEKRALILLNNILPAIWGHEFIEIQIIKFNREYVGKLKFDIKKFYSNENDKSKEYFLNCIIEKDFHINF